MPVSARRGLTRKSGDGGAQEGIPGHKTFTSSRPQPVFQVGTMHVGEEKMRSEIGRMEVGVGEHG